MHMADDRTLRKQLKCQRRNAIHLQRWSEKSLVILLIYEKMRVLLTLQRDIRGSSLHTKLALSF